MQGLHERRHVLSLVSWAARRIRPDGNRAAWLSDQRGRTCTAVTSRARCSHSAAEASSLWSLICSWCWWTCEQVSGVLPAHLVYTSTHGHVIPQLAAFVFKRCALLGGRLAFKPTAIQMFSERFHSPKVYFLQITKTRRTELAQFNKSELELRICCITSCIE